MWIYRWDKILKGAGQGEGEGGSMGVVGGWRSMTSVPYDMKAVECGNLSMAWPTTHLIKLCTVCVKSLYFIFQGYKIKFIKKLLILEDKCVITTLKSQEVSINLSKD